MMKILLKQLLVSSLLVQLVVIATASADLTSATIQALRMSGGITGGLMPTNSPEFAQMVSAIQANDYKGAATIAVNSKYFAQYLPRRMARQMMNPTLNEADVPDNDATTLIVANLIGSATPPSISSIWSQNATYFVNVLANGVVTAKHVQDLTTAQLAAVNWKTDLVQVTGQAALVKSGDTFTATTLPAQHVGGFMTLNYVFPGGNNLANDKSFAQFGLKDGTNLRAIEGMYEVAFGLSLPEMVVPGATAAEVPRFVPKLSPNFFQGQGQPACISCHGGGASNLTHGYATFADVFDFEFGNGLVYIPTPSTDTKKSLGSDPDLRNRVATCNLTLKPAPSCNPDSLGASPTQAWDLSTWQSAGLLATMGWQGPIAGSGLNALGTSLGKASLAYKFLTKRVMKEICPLGTFSDAQFTDIASQAQQLDSFANIVIRIASDPSCL